MASVLAGSFLGWLGSWIPIRPSFPTLWLILGVLSLLLAIREFGWARFPIPQWKRQTEKTWSHRMHPIVAAWWWGIDLGSGLTTLVTFSGYWLLVIVALLQGEPGYGALVLGMYGLGRGLAVWLPPHLLKGMPLQAGLRALLMNRSFLHRWHGYELIGMGLGMIVRGLVT